MTSTITQIASDLNEQVENRYALILEIADLAKRLLDEAREKQDNEPFYTGNASSPEKVIYQALIVKASEIDLGDDQLIG